MKLDNLWERLRNRSQRSMADYCFRGALEMRNRMPLISFTFDDFPRSALANGGEILKKHGVRGTYYTSLGLMGKPDEPVGEIFAFEDLAQALRDGHELGCHTFHHCHAWKTPANAFEQSVIENQRSLDKLFAGASFRTLSYPIAVPRPFTKRRMARHFLCCRSGGQTYNIGRISPTHLRGFFLEQSNLDSMKKIVAENCLIGGWLIFATHDVCATPSRFGCSVDLFDSIVRYAKASKATVLPVREAWEKVCGDQAS